jgi:hypothetical protein
MKNISPNDWINPGENGGPTGYPVQEGTKQSPLFPCYLILNNKR